MSPETPPPAGMTGPPGWLLHVIRDQRVAFLVVGVINTAFSWLCFAALLLRFREQWHYLVILAVNHVISVLFAFVLHRYLVFRVRGHVLADLWRFETVYLVALAVNFVLLPLLVEIAHMRVLLAQTLIVLVTSVMSWVGHKNYSFRRSPSSEGLRR